MAFVVTFDLAREFAVAAPADEVFALLADVPLSASHVPKLVRLVDLGDDTFRWEMEKIGTKRVPVMKRLVAPMVMAENEKLIKQYVSNLARRFGGEV
jgi:hypothetical protein